ncbi:tetratricopeptide repeat protein [Planosporangium thailandense]|uniref:Tetratricopeptide repeat protein n=1 Tax=Planosporangium thailandense TaxID=765197 RepID=A0ABX0XXI6_9ACTN|nr:tetratricopeptide repeat protein [Planosporangium thailandense]NJC69950.1 tetratricopeptide repeat protein [Planosporangium thailandense]
MDRDSRSPSYGGARDLMDLWSQLLARKSRPKVRQLARQAQISAGYVSEILGGQKTPSPDVAERLAAALGATPVETRLARFYAERAQDDPKPPARVPVAHYSVQTWSRAVPPAETLIENGMALSALLAERYEVIDFFGRSDQLRELGTWRDGRDDITAKLITGAGGEGKTRLATYFARQSKGWVVAEAFHGTQPHRPGRAVSARRVSQARGLLLIVDYAERWPLTDLLDLVNDPLLATGVPVRILLIARSGGTWWNVLHTRLEKSDVIADHMPLPRIAPGRIDRLAVFDAARDRFAELLGMTEFQGISPPSSLLENAGPGQVLTLHMAALIAVDAKKHGIRPPTDPASFSRHLLERERDHWYAMHDKPQNRLPTPPSVMARAVFAATLTGPHDWDYGISVLNRVGIGSDTSPEQIVDDHAICYPPADELAVLEPLYPDRLAEDFVALQIPGHGVPGPSDPWASRAVQRLLPTLEDPTPTYLPRLVSVLAEAAGRWPHVGRSQLFPLLRTRPRLAFAAGSAALAAVASLPDIDVEVLEAIETEFPSNWHSDVPAGIAAVAQRLTELRLPTTDDRGRAFLYARLGKWLGEAGLYERALACSTKAAEIHREVLERNPRTSAGGLAAALRNQARDLAVFGRHEEALHAAREALRLWQQMPQDDLDVYQHHVGQGFQALSLALSELGRFDEAQAATRSAAEIYEQLAVRDDSFETYLAGALHNLGVDLARTGKYEEAAASGQRAVDIYQRLLPRDGSVEPKLAAALMSLGNHLSALSQQESAVVAGRNAVEIYRRLASKNTAVYGLQLGMSLYNLATTLFGMHERAESLKSAAEALDVLRHLAAADPAAYASSSTMMLAKVGCLFLNAGQFDDASVAIREAIHGPAAHYLRRSKRHSRDFAEALLQFVAICARDRCELPVALDASTEAVRMLESLAKTHPDSTSDLARAKSIVAKLTAAIGSESVG